MGTGYLGNKATDYLINQTTDYSSWNDLVKSTGIFDNTVKTPAGEFYTNLLADGSNPGGIATASTAGTLTSNAFNGISPS